ncbi:MAG: MoaD/ThiS family protein [Planctomycetaceae bacterium]|nr:MoaD/ThiS family protein [Planctomycetaceae bacterium]MCB9953990.1 MoaD/ThiS family protein [Planctomycetaceae bacterium]
MLVVNLGSMSHITVEFFGIPRERAGTSCVQIEATTLGQVVEQLAGQFPEFANHCFDDNEISTHCLVAVNAIHFTRDLNWKLAPGDTVQFLSADVGG